MAVINPHQETHPSNNPSPPSNDNSPGHPANQQWPTTPDSSTGSGSDSTVSSGSSGGGGGGSGSGGSGSSQGSGGSGSGGSSRRRRQSNQPLVEVKKPEPIDDESTLLQNPAGPPVEGGSPRSPEQPEGESEQDTGARRDEEEGPARPPVPPTPEIDRSNAGAVMNAQSGYLNEQAARKSDTAEAEAARQSQLAVYARAMAEQWRASEYDGGFQDAQGEAVSASSYYEGWAQSFEAKAAENRAIAQQNQTEATRVAEQNAAGQAAVEQFNTADANALAPVQSEGATADDYTHVADTYAQLQAEWKDKPANGFVQIPVGGSIQPANPAGYFERQERLFRRLASEAGDPEGGVTPGATSEVLYNRVTQGGEFVQDSQPTVSQYTADGSADRVIAYQTADGRAAVGHGVFQPADPLYQGMTAGGELVQQR